jgi:hypothetical protein
LRHLRQRLRDLHRDQPALRGRDVIEGRDGLSLFDHWHDSYQTLHGMTSRGFPNQFFTGFIQGGVSANTTAMFEQQAEHIAYIIAEAQQRGATTVEPSAQGQDGWVNTVRELAIDNSAFELSCTPGYYNNEGQGGAKATARSSATSTHRASTPSTTCSPNGGPRVTDGLELGSR